MIDLIGYVGVVLYLVAYLLVTTGRLAVQSRAYQGMNIVAAMAVGTNAYIRGAVPSGVLNTVWLAIALFGYRSARRRAD